jgi:hypothetical protein
MPTPTLAQLLTASSFLARADARLGAAAVASARPHPEPGEFDNNFDGVVTAIFHVVDAFELMTTGLRRASSEADQATRIRSAVTGLSAAGITGLPAVARLIDLNRRRNTSVHGEWMEVLDAEALENAVAAARALLDAVRAYAAKRGLAIDVS